MDQIRAHLLLFLAVVGASAIPFVPTGEMVSGSSALAAHSRHQIYVIFLVTWAASVIGDTLLLLEARLGARKVRRWLARWKYSYRVDQAQYKLQRNALSAVVTGRLVPGGRAPVIIALGLSRFSIRQFILFDAVACAMWAAIYSTVGSVGGRIAAHPIWGMVLAIIFAIAISVLVQQLIKLVAWLHRRRQAQDASAQSAAQSSTTTSVNDQTPATKPDSAVTADDSGDDPDSDNSQPTAQLHTDSRHRAG